MESDPSSAIILYPAPEGIVTISCPKCSFTRRVEAKSIKRASEGFSIRCRCGDIFKARVEFRKHYRKMVKLIGIFRNLRIGRQGQTVVEDLSISGVGFRTSGRHDLLMGDSLEVNFNLYDRKNSKISLRVEVKRIQDQLVGPEIEQESRGNRDLGFYLRG
jgi:PilZ domain